jgi:hypothetical protein
MKMMKNGEMQEARLIDTSVSERAIREARKEMCCSLSEQILLRIVDVGTPPDLLIERAWRLAGMQYDAMIKARAAPDQPVTLTERMAADNLTESARRYGHP